MNTAINRRPSNVIDTSMQSAAEALEVGSYLISHFGGSLLFRIHDKRSTLPVKWGTNRQQGFNFHSATSCRKIGTAAGREVMSRETLEYRFHRGGQPDDGPSCADGLPIFFPQHGSSSQRH